MNDPMKDLYDHRDAAAQTARFIVGLRECGIFVGVAITNHPVTNVDPNQGPCEPLPVFTVQGDPLPVCGTDENGQVVPIGFINQIIAPKTAMRLAVMDGFCGLMRADARPAELREFMLCCYKVDLNGALKIVREVLIK